MAKHALVILADGLEEIEAVTPVDILRRAGVEVTTAALDSLTVCGSHRITLTADTALAELRCTFDAVILPGGMPGSQVLGESYPVRDLVTQHWTQGKLVAAICAAPAMALAKFGVLDGKKATCYPGFEKRFPARTEYCPAKVVVDGNLVTASGPGAAFEFGLELVRQLVDNDTAASLAEAMQAT